MARGLNLGNAEVKAGDFIEEGDLYEGVFFVGKALVQNLSRQGAIFVDPARVHAMAIFKIYEVHKFFFLGGNRGFSVSLN